MRDTLYRIAHGRPSSTSRRSTTLLLPTGHRSNERPSFFFWCNKKNIPLSDSLPLSVCSFPSAARRLPLGRICGSARRGDRNNREDRLLLLRNRRARRRALLPYRSRRARSMRRSEQEDEAGLNPLKPNGFWSEILFELPF